MKALVQANKHSTIRELAIALKVSVGSVHGHLKSLGFVKKLGGGFGYRMSERNSDESYERLRSTHQTQRKRSVLETYDHERRKMDCLQQCQPKKKLE